MQILDGRLVAQKIKDRLKMKIADFLTQNRIAPGLRVILIGDNPASQVYVRQKVKSRQRGGDRFSNLFSTGKRLSPGAKRKNTNFKSRLFCSCHIGSIASASRFFLAGSYLLDSSSKGP